MQGTFYCHFRSKNDILEEVAKMSISSLVEKMHEIAERGDKDAGRGGWSCEDEFLMLRYVE